LEEYRPYLVEMPLREALEGYLMGGVEWSRTQVGFLRLFARAAYQGDTDLADRLVRPIAAALRQIVEEILAKAIARDEVRQDIDLESTARVVHALTIAIGDSQLLPYLNEYFQVTGEEVTIERIVQSMLDLITSGVQPLTKSE
jgi:AcrR family transcriptional regulator